MSDVVTLLLVEDQALIRTDLEDMLREAGFGVVALADGTAAIREIDREARGYRALVTDVDLGPGPSGWEVARHLREAVPTMPVVYVSGTSAERWAAQGVPGSIMVPKPFVDAQILTALATLMNTAESMPHGAHG